MTIGSHANLRVHINRSYRVGPRVQAGQVPWNTNPEEVEYLSCRALIEASKTAVGILPPYRTFSALYTPVRLAVLQRLAQLKTFLDAE